MKQLRARVLDSSQEHSISTEGYLLFLKDRDLVQASSLLHEALNNLTPHEAGEEKNKIFIQGPKN